MRRRGEKGGEGKKWGKTRGEEGKGNEEERRRRRRDRGKESEEERREEKEEEKGLRRKG